MAIVTPAHAASSFDLYYSGRFKSALEHLATEIKTEQFEPPALSTRIGFLFELYSKLPRSKLSDLEASLSGFASQKGADRIKPTLNERLKVIQGLRQQAPTTPADGEKSLNEAVQTENSALLEILSLIFEWKTYERVASPEWWYLLGKAKSKISHSGKFYLKQYLADERAKDPNHVKDANKMMEDETKWKSLGHVP